MRSALVTRPAACGIRLDVRIGFREQAAELALDQSYIHAVSSCDVAKSDFLKTWLDASSVALQALLIAIGSDFAVR